TFKNKPRFEQVDNIKQTWFTGLEALLVLVLSNNNIKEIQPRSFVHLTKLQLLDLENNMLQVVDPAWLFGLEGTMNLNLRSNAINSISPRSFQHLWLTWIDLVDNDLACLDREVLWGQSMLSRLHVSSGMLSSVNHAMPREMKWRIDRLASVTRGLVTMVVEVPNFHFCIRYNAYDLSFGWMFNSSDNTVNNNDVSAVNINPGRSCGDLDSSLSMIPIQPPVVVLATDGSLADKLDTNVNTLEQCRQVWEYDGGITVVLIENSVLRLVSMATGNATSEGVAMSGKHTKVFFTVPLDQSQTHTTETSYRIGINHSSSVIHYSETTEKGDTSSKPRDYPTLGVVSSTPGPDLEVAQAPDHALITSVVLSAVIVLVMSFLAVLTWKACAAKLDAEDERAGEDAHVWTIPPGVTFPGLLRSASLPASRSDKMASEDAASCRSLPAVLHSIEPTYSEIADDLACAQRPLPGLPQGPAPVHTYSGIPDDVARAQSAQRPQPGLSNMPAHTYSEIPDDKDSRLMPVYSTDFPLHVVPNMRHDRQLFGDNSRRQLSERSIATYGPTGQTNGQRNLFYRNASLVKGMRARRQREAALISQTDDQGVMTYVNVTGAIMSRRQHVTRAVLTLPKTYWPWEIPGEGTPNTPLRASLPTVTPHNTYWPWEIPGEGTRNTPRRASLPTVTPPNTYWPWEIPGEGTRNTPRRASLPTVTPPNTYWPWEIPGEGTRNTPRRASLPTVTPPNTYWPWEIPGEGTCNTPQRASLPTVTLPNTYWPWEIPGEGTRNTPRRASLPTVTPPNTYWPWEIPGEGIRCNIRVSVRL
ncbi:hypothetical protein Bbelb_423380, partial [Branchiostoma belcheri]